MENTNKGRAEHTLVWTIENFKYAWHKKGEKLVSPVFVTDMLGKTAWTLALYPRGAETDEYIDCLFNMSQFPADGYTFDYELIATPEGGSTSRVCGVSEPTNSFPHLMKREVIDRMKKCSHQSNLTVQCRIMVTSDVHYNFVGESFAKTHIVVEQISHTHCFESDVAYESILVRRMSGSKPLLIIRLSRMRGNDLGIELLPFDGYESVRYFSYKLTLDESETKTRLCNHSAEDWSCLTPRTVNVSLSPVLRLGHPEKRNLRLNYELTFSTGNEQTESGRIVTSYHDNIITSI